MRQSCCRASSPTIWTISTAQGALHAGLLSPQGKILFEFFVVKSPDGFCLETRAGQGGGAGRAAQDVQAARRRRDQGRLRRLYGGGDLGCGEYAPRGVGTAPLWFADPRLPELGYRELTTLRSDWALGAEQCDSATQDDYHAHRIALGVPEGGKDYAFGDAFPHEALFDQLNGVSFEKGCYVGQEVVSRMQNRGTARRRIVPVVAEAALPASGAAITAGGVEIGTLGSVDGRARAALPYGSTAPPSSSTKARRCAAGDVRCASSMPRLGALFAEAESRARRMSKARRYASCAAPGPATTPTTSAITTRNGACR